MTRPMKTSFLSALLLLLPAVTQANLPPLHNLELSGESVGKWTFFSIYDAKFYMPKNASSSQALDALSPGRLEICYLRDIRKDQLIEAAQHVLDDLALTPRQQTQVNALHAAYRDVKEGDCFVMDYRPQTGLSLYFNGQKVHQENDPSFKSTYWQVWLGKEPLSERVRNELLALKPQESDF